MIKTITDLKLAIDYNLSQLIDNEYVLFDVPEHRNIGDQMIWKGELDFLKTIDHKCLFTSSVGYHRNLKLSPKTLILLHGGGNFGDVWKLHQNFREDIILKYPNNKIIIFPQSVEFKDKKTLNQSSKIFNQHGNISICARDNYSFDFLNNHFNNCNILLVPDMAFYSTLDKSVTKLKENDLILKRIDKELGNEIDHNKYIDFEIKDWPTYNTNYIEFFKKRYSDLNRRVSVLLMNNNLKELDNFRTFGFLPYRKREEFINIGVKFISSYKINITTRLHGHIFSLLLGIPSIIIDNSYGKNKRFYNTWLKDLELSFFAENIDEAMKIYHKINKKQ